MIRAVGENQKSLTCPYHDWTYDLEGKLISVPDESEEYGKVDKSCFSLKPAAVDLWRGMIFVHPQPNATPLAKWFGDVEQYLGPHSVEELPEYPDARTSYEIKANWKIVVENYIDVYHLSHLHSATLNMYDHSQAEYEFVGPHYAFKEPLSRDYAKDLVNNSPMPLVIPEAEAAAWVPMLFPGIGLAESESNWATFIITPLSPTLTRIENRVRVANASEWEFGKQGVKSYAYWKNSGTGKYASSEQDSDPMTSGDFTAEDVFACEQQQKSFTSPFFEVGPAAKGEKPNIRPPTSYS